MKKTTGRVARHVARRAGGSIHSALYPDDRTTPDHATARARRRVRPLRLIAGAFCLELAVLGILLAWANAQWLPLVPMPDPPPPGHPWYRLQAMGKLRFFGGCWSAPILAVVGLVLLVSALRPHDIR